MEDVTKNSGLCPPHFYDPGHVLECTTLQMVQNELISGGPNKQRGSEKIPKLNKWGGQVKKQAILP